MTHACTIWTSTLTENKRRSLVKGGIKERVGVLSVTVLRNGREWPSVIREEPLRVRSILVEDVPTCHPVSLETMGLGAGGRKSSCVNSHALEFSVHGFSAVGKGQLC